MKLIKHLLSLIVLINGNAGLSFGQFNIRDSSLAFPMIGVSAAYQFPAGNLSERFGNNVNVGGVFHWKLKNNIVLGLEGNFLFSDNVKENYILDSYKTPDGNIIDGNGGYSVVSLSERGMKFEIKAGKIFPVLGPNKNSGIMVTIGTGFLQHKILIETPQGNVPYLKDQYRKGFDRLTNGICLTEFIGYMYFSNRKLVNFYAGLEFTQAFTKNKRAQNFDTGLSENTSRTDLLNGVRFGWVIPIYKRVADKHYIN